MIDFGPPPPTEAIATAALYALAYGVTGWIVRALLRDPGMPRWVIIILIVAASHLPGPFIRDAASHEMYHAGLREGWWPTLWLAVGVTCFLYALLRGNHIPPALDIVDAHEGPAGYDDRDTTAAEEIGLHERADEELGRQPPEDEVPGQSARRSR